MATWNLARIFERGQPDDENVTEGRLHAAFLLFVSGGLLCLIAAAVLVAAQLFPETFTLSMRFVLRHVGGVIGGIGATALFAGIVAALSTRAYMRWLAAVGGVIAVAGVAGFGYAYPYHWGVGQDLSVPVILVLTAGFTLLVGSTFAAVVSNLILRQRIRKELREDLGREPTDAEVERDVQEALSQYTFNWGGVREDNTKGLTFTEEPLEGYQVHGWRPNRDEELDDYGSLERSTSTLLKFRGGAQHQGDIALDGVDQKGAALADLRRQKAQATANRPVNRLRSWLAHLWARIKAWFAGRNADAEDREDGT